MVETSDVDGSGPEPAGSGQRRQLVVLVPGLTGPLPRWASLRERLSREAEFDPAHTVWLPIDHRLHALSLGRLEAHAVNIAARINATWLNHGGFDDVLLIGHSIGGPLIRRAFLLAATESGPAPSEWAAAVRRIVLFASISRGIDMDARWRRWAVAWILRMVPLLPRFVTEDAMRGSTFLTNLRLDWINHFARLPRAPLVVQLLGTRDSMVNSEDSRDLLAFPNAHYLSVPDADHTSLFSLDDAPNAELRYAVLRKALLGRFEGGDRVDTPDAGVERVVFLLHGIRASIVEDWLEDLAARIRRRGGGRVVVIAPEYGWVSAAGFALPPIRGKFVRVLQDQYTEAVARYPRAEFSVIAHSNGTYMLGHAMLKSPGIRFQHVYLAGSVLPQDFWGRFAPRPLPADRIRNDCASRDWPVALLCNALSGVRMKDVGTGGFAGFLGNSTQEVAYLAGGHDAALLEKRRDSVVDFILGQNVVVATDVSGPGWFRPFSNAMPYVAWILVGGFVVVGAFGAFTNRVPGALAFEFHPLFACGLVLSVLVVYVLLDIL